MQISRGGVDMDERDAVTGNAGAHVPAPRHGSPDPGAAYRELFDATRSGAVQVEETKPPRKQKVKSVRRTRRRAIVLVVVLLLLGGAAAGGWAYVSQARKQPALDALRAGNAAFEPVPRACGWPPTSTSCAPPPSPPRPPPTRSTAPPARSPRPTASSSAGCGPCCATRRLCSGGLGRDRGRDRDAGPLARRTRHHGRGRASLDADVKSLASWRPRPPAASAPAGRWPCTATTSSASSPAAR